MMRFYIRTGDISVTNYTKLCAADTRYYTDNLITCYKYVL
jgi:hypothetical protein